MLAHDGFRSPIGLRFAVAGAVVAAYLAALTPLALFGHEGIFWVSVLGIGGLPCLMIAVGVGFLFAARIVLAPWKWAIAAGTVGIGLSCIVLAILGGPWWTGLFGAPIAIIAAIVFPLALRTFRSSRA